MLLGRSPFTYFRCGKCVLQGWGCADPEPCRELEVSGSAGRKVDRSETKRRSSASYMLNS